MPAMRPRSLAVTLTAALWAQQSAPVFHAGTKLVEVTVTVLDKKGNAVTGLEAGDFTIQDSGKARPVSFFRFDSAPAAAAPAADGTAAAKLPAGVFTNRVELGADTP